MYATQIIPESDKAMIHQIDSHRLELLKKSTDIYASPELLHRVGELFFIGANLPIHSTLETMYESYCQESSELFHVTFGEAGLFEHNLEMVRQIKRNFSIRLMGRIEYRLSAAQIERVYLAGLDLLDIQRSSYDIFSGSEVDYGSDGWRIAIEAARATFTRWSVISTIDAEHATPQTVRENIRELLEKGVIPLLKAASDRSLWSFAETGNIYEYLATEWHKYRVPLKPIMSLLRLTTPFVLTEQPGFLRNVIDKIQDRSSIATSDLRRHLRTSGAEASFESAGL